MSSVLSVFCGGDDSEHRARNRNARFHVMRSGGNHDDELDGSNRNIVGQLHDVVLGHWNPYAQS